MASSAGLTRRKRSWCPGPRCRPVSGRTAVTHRRGADPAGGLRLRREHQRRHRPGTGRDQTRPDLRSGRRRSAREPVTMPAARVRWRPPRAGGRAAVGVGWSSSAMCGRGPRAGCSQAGPRPRGQRTIVPSAPVTTATGRGASRAARHNVIGRAAESPSRHLLHRRDSGYSGAPGRLPSSSVWAGRPMFVV